MQTKIHIFTHSMYLARKQCLTRVCGVEPVYGTGFVRTCVGVVLRYEWTRHPWRWIKTAVAIILIMASASWTVLPLSVSCRSPDGLYPTSVR